MREETRDGITFKVIKNIELQKLIHEKTKDFLPFQDELIKYENSFDPDIAENSVSSDNDIVNQFAKNFASNDITENPPVSLLFALHARLITLFDDLITHPNEAEIPMIDHEKKTYDDPILFALIGLYHDPQRNIFVIPFLSDHNL